MRCNGLGVLLIDGRAKRAYAAKLLDFGYMVGLALYHFTENLVAVNVIKLKFRSLYAFGCRTPWHKAKIHICRTKHIVWKRNLT